MTPDLEFVAISDRERVLLADRRGRTVWQFPHPAWGQGDSESGSCWVSPDGRHVWATTPAADGPDEWVVLDASSGRVLCVSPLQTMAAASTPIPHPDGQHVGLSVGEGQDGAEVYWGRWENGHEVVTRLDDRSRVLIDVRPSGGEFLTTPHSDSDGAIAIHEFPGGRVLARLSAADVLEEEDWFDFSAGYVSDDLIL